MLNHDKKTATDTPASSPESLPKFNIRARYDDLNDSKKRLLKKAFHGRFGGIHVTFYNRLSSENLTLDEGMFFSGLFECKVEDLYTHAPDRQTSIFDLARKAKGGKSENQVGLD